MLLAPPYICMYDGHGGLASAATSHYTCFNIHIGDMDSQYFPLLQAEMAASFETSKATCHIRSISLPSRSHPLTVSVEEQLCRLRSSSQAISSSACQKLSNLKVLYECVHELLQLPLTQQALSHDQHDKLVENVLNGSLRLLDVCGTTRDIFSQIRECLKELESALRRKRGAESSLASDVEAYTVTRRSLNTLVHRYLKNVQKNTASKISDKDSKVTAVVGTLREVEEISLAVFESLLSLVSQPKAKSSIVSKLLQSKRTAQDNTNEVEKMDAELLVLKSGKHCSPVQVQNVLRGLEALESSIQEAEEELECVYRKLVKTRVSILNILNH